MATDEMRDISTDKWSDDIWGIPCGDVKTPKLVFYFGRNDHWVAERTRDEIIAMRGKCGGPKMVVCEDGLPHGFSIRKFVLLRYSVRWCFVLQGLWIRSLHGK